MSLYCGVVMVEKKLNAKSDYNVKTKLTIYDDTNFGVTTLELYSTNRSRNNTIRHERKILNVLKRLLLR